MPPVAKTIFDDVEEPLTAEERAQLASEWLKRTINRLTPDQQRAALYRLKKLKKLQPKKRRGGQLKWDDHELRVLGTIYKDYREIFKLKRDDAIEAIAGLYGRSPKTIATNLSKANKLPNAPQRIEKK